MSKTANKEALIDEKAESKTQIYEIGYLLAPTLTDEELPKAYGDLKALVEGAGGAIISDEMPKLINLAYTMQKTIANIRHKFDTAFFGWVKFEINTDSVEGIKKKLDFDPNYVRFLITKTVRENTISQKKFVSKETIRRKTAPKEEGTQPAEINKEELDKEIDAMVEV